MLTKRVTQVTLTRTADEFWRVKWTRTLAGGKAESSRQSHFTEAAAR